MNFAIQGGLESKAVGSQDDSAKSWDEKRSESRGVNYLSAIFQVDSEGNVMESVETAEIKSRI